MKDESQAAPRRGRGCLGWGCTITLGLLVVILLFAGWVALWQFRVPYQLGLVQSPAEEVFTGTPDRQAAANILAELQKAGVNTKGASCYVMPFKDRDTAVAYVVLDLSQGFSFSGVKSADPIVDYLTRIASSAAARAARVERVAVDLRDREGEQLLMMTATSKALTTFASGGMTRQAFLKELQGTGDFAKLSVGVPW